MLFILILFSFRHKKLLRIGIQTTPSLSYTNQATPLKLHPLAEARFLKVSFQLDKKLKCKFESQDLCQKLKMKKLKIWCENIKMRCYTDYQRDFLFAPVSHSTTVLDFCHNLFSFNLYKKSRVRKKKKQ